MAFYWLQFAHFRHKAVKESRATPSFYESMAAYNRNGCAYADDGRRQVHLLATGLCRLYCRRLPRALAVSIMFAIGFDDVRSQLLLLASGLCRLCCRRLLRSLSEDHVCHHHSNVPHARLLRLCHLRLLFRDFCFGHLGGLFTLRLQIVSAVQAKITAIR